MGKTRVKALKSKEGALPVDALNDKHNKHVTFGDDGVVDVDLDQPEIVQSYSNNPVNALNDEPEEVQQDSVDISRLQSEIEGLFSSQKLSKRKRKQQQAFMPTPFVPTSDEYLDESALDELNAAKSMQPKSMVEERADDEEQLSEAEPDNRPMTRRKIGRLEVATIVQKGFHEFQMNDEAKQFLASQQSNGLRVKYSTYSKQRRPVPAKQFAVRR